MKMKRLLMLLLSVATLCYSLSATATIPAGKISASEKIKLEYAMALLAQPFDKIQRCAQIGIIGYQNALSAYYLVGHSPVNKSPVLAYAWALVANHQLEETKNPILLKGQKRTLHFLAANMNMQQIMRAKQYAQQFTADYGQKWPHPPLLDAKKIPTQCQLVIHGVKLTELLHQQQQKLQQ